MTVKEWVGIGVAVLAAFMLGRRRQSRIISERYVVMETADSSRLDEPRHAADRGPA